MLSYAARLAATPFGKLTVHNGQGMELTGNDRCMWLMLSGALTLQVLSLLVGGGMALRGAITPEQLTTFVLYVEFVTAASLSVCDQWGRLLHPEG